MNKGKVIKLGEFLLVNANQSEKKDNLISQKKGKLNHSIKSPAERILHLQMTVGNQAVQKLIRAGTLQAKLKVGQPGDRYEQEADRVADAVMRMPEPQAVPGSESHIRRACPTCEEEGLRRQPIEEEEEKLQKQSIEEEEEELQAKATSGTISEVNSNLESHIQSLKGGGQPLSENDRAFFEPHFGHDFSQVRVHTDAKAAEAARAVNARAFTVGQDVVFGTEQYAPGVSDGRRLMAHELTHFIQQKSSGNIHIARYIDAWMPGMKSFEDSQKRSEAKTKTARKVVSTVTIKRKNISLKGEDKYGHWWAEIDGSESYGWWPKYPVGLWETLTGTDGELNGETSFSGTLTKDPHHGDSADEYFNPTAPAGTTDAAIKTCIRKFAKSYSGEWRWTLGWGQNCHTFQEDMMKNCDLQEK